MTLVTMSEKEIGRLGVLRDVDAGRLTAGADAAVLGITERQIYRLLEAYRRDGPSGLVSSRRGKPSNRQTSEPMRQHAMRLIREYYTEFRPDPGGGKAEGSPSGRVFTGNAAALDDGRWLVA